MATVSTPNPRARAALARLCAAIEQEAHWVFLTDAPFAAGVLRRADVDALFVEAVMCLTDRCETFPLAVLAVSKSPFVS